MKKSMGNRGYKLLHLINTLYLFGYFNISKIILVIVSKEYLLRNTFSVYQWEY